MAKFVVKNVTRRPLTISDITTYGIEILPGKTFDLAKAASLSQIGRSQNLQDALKAKFIIVYDQKSKKIERQDLAEGYLGRSVVDEVIYGSDVTSGTSGTVDLSTAKLTDIGDVDGALNQSSTLVYDTTTSLWKTTWPLGGTINRVGDAVSSIVYTSGKTVTFNRDGEGLISSVADGSLTWTFTRNVDKQIASWTVT